MTKANAAGLASPKRIWKRRPTRSGAPATLNYPLTIGDHLWADDGAGVEMHIGSSAVRMAALTAVEFLNLDDRVAQLSLQQGALEIRVVSLENDEVFEIEEYGEERFTHPVAGGPGVDAARHGDPSSSGLSPDDARHGRVRPPSAVERAVMTSP